MYSVWRPEIAFEDKDQRCIVVSKEIMDYLDDHMDTEDLNDGDIIDVFYVDIDESVIADLQKLAKTDEEKQFVSDLVKYDCDWINVMPHYYVCV